MKVSDLWIKDSQRKTNISEANNKIFISIINFQKI
jgi:dimeric dUTPase (all-alpha-NTP-PPase superfamily)